MTHCYDFVSIVEFVDIYKDSWFSRIIYRHLVEIESDDKVKN